jgi:hypothetical protein
MRRDPRPDGPVRARWAVDLGRGRRSLPARAFLLTATFLVDLCAADVVA